MLWLQCDACECYTVMAANMLCLQCYVCDARPAISYMYDAKTFHLRRCL
jgi:hypothetical protein